MNTDVILSLDWDWFPQALAGDVLGLLDEAGVAATLFMTDQPRLDLPERHEIALHPFARTLEDLPERIAALQAQYPGARGVRTHRLLGGGPAYAAFDAAGLAYCSLYMLLGQPHLAPLRLPFDIVEFPIFYSDIAQIYEADLGRATTQPARLLDVPGMKVFAFHPVHIYLNCTRTEDYLQGSGPVMQPGAGPHLRRPGRGARDWFVEFLAALGPGDYTYAAYLERTTARGDAA